VNFALFFHEQDLFAITGLDFFHPSKHKGLQQILTVHIIQLPTFNYVKIPSGPTIRMSYLPARKPKTS